MKRTYVLVIAIAALLFTASCGGSTALQEPTVFLTGTWDISELITEASGVCSDSVGNTSSYTLNVVQDGNELTITVGNDAPENAGAVFTGTVSGDHINWSGSYPTSGGTTEVTSTDITATNTEFSGTANWKWSDGYDSCSGKTQVVGYKI